MWVIVNERIEGAFDEHEIVKQVAFIAPSFSPVEIPNVAVVEDAALLPEGDDEVAGKDDSFFRVARLQGIGQAGSLACEEVADAELAAGVNVMAVAVLDGDAAAEGVELGEAAGVGGGEAEAEDAAEGDVKEGPRGGGQAAEEEERTLGGEVGWRRREEIPVGAAGGAEGEEVLEGRQAARDERDQLR